MILLNYPTKCRRQAQLHLHPSLPSFRTSKYMSFLWINLAFTKNTQLPINSCFTEHSWFYSIFRYIHNTPKKLKLVDAYLSYVFFTGVVQFLYCCLVGTFPFNAFLSGFISCVGSFILGVCLRLQVNNYLFIQIQVISLYFFYLLKVTQAFC